VITSVSIRNLRGIREGALEGLTPLTVLVGPNSSGKSTILDALLIGAGRQPGAAAGYSVRRRPGLRYGARWLLWRGQGEASAEIVLGLATGETRTAKLEWRDAVDISELRRRLAEQGAEGPYSSVDIDVTTTAPMDGSMNSVAVFAADNTYKASDDSARSDAPALTDAWLVDPRFGHPLSELYSRIAERGRRQAVRDLVASIVPGLEVIEILTEHNDPRLHLTFPDHSVPVALAGDGVQALVRMSLELASRSGGAVLLEEPEAHQHPAAIRASAQAIVEGVRRGVQVVLTTHSLELIDALLAAIESKEVGLLSLHRLKLVDAVLRHSRLDGEEIGLSRGEIGDDLR
jgi:predicted ATPase